MDEISQWFQEEFGDLGFEITQTVYNPDDFIPMRGVMWKRPNGTYIKTNIHITTNLSNDLTSSYHDPVLEYKSLISDYINLFLESEGYTKDFKKNFKPRKKISKLKL